LSLVLRHKPEEIDLTLDSKGWAKVTDLLEQLAKYKKKTTREELEHMVETNSKQRFRISDDGTRIRASQGHSIDIDLDLEPIAPPEFLYHGTASRFLKSIRQKGLNSRNRKHVHLSSDLDTATKVGMRHGTPAILRVEAQRMHQAGYKFYLSDNEVWLTETVPLQYLDRDH